MTTTDAPAPSISSSLLARADLGAGSRGQMFALLDRHFAGVCREQFEHDLESKDWVLLLRDMAGNLAGFSTLAVYETNIKSPNDSLYSGCSAGTQAAPPAQLIPAPATPSPHNSTEPSIRTAQTVSVVCSGDTIVDPNAWSSAALPREWIAAVKQLRSRFPRGPYYWLLLTSGFRTYRLLSTFWKSFWPRYDTATPMPTQSLLDTLAGERFGDRYDRSAGVVRFERPQVLRPHLAGVPPERLRDPHVAFFAARNAGHERGDELVCLCELSDSNLTRAGARMAFGPEVRSP
jgi:hypothetical protein